MTEDIQQGDRKVIARKRKIVQIPIRPVRARIVGSFANGSSVAQVADRYRGIGRPGVEECLREALRRAA